MLYRLILATALAWTTLAGANEPFRFHLLTEPQNLDPQTSAAASGNYLFHNLYRGLYVYGPRGLKLDGARSCRRQPLRLICQLRPRKWSSGTPITAEDYLRAFRRLIDPANKSPQADVLFSLKNARAIWDGKQNVETLGIEATDPQTLIFHFAEEDPEFEYRLIHPGLSPLPPGGYKTRDQATAMAFSGPYRIGEWKSGAWVRLEPNLHYDLGNPRRPAAEALFIDEDSTALRLYEAGKLTFLRRLIAAEFPRFRDSPEFHQIPMARFDYVGFGPQLKAAPLTRGALIRGIEFADFKRLFGARSPAGCPSLPATYMDKVTCLKPELTEAKNLASRTPAPKLEMQFSRMGGDDIVRAAEWFQGQWKRHLGWSIELKSQEQAVYLAGLRKSPPPIFRKGVSLDRPTCLAALEIFLKGHPENFIGLDDARYGDLVAKLARAPTAAARKVACRRAVDHLLSLDRLIPLGEMHFTILANRQFRGWELNELNQLDLSQLTGP